MISYKKKKQEKKQQQINTQKLYLLYLLLFVILKKEFNRFQKIMDANKNNAYLPHLGKFFDT